jgi:hypothetical protein
VEDDDENCDATNGVELRDSAFLRSGLRHGRFTGAFACGRDRHSAIPRRSGTPSRVARERRDEESARPGE